MSVYTNKYYVARRNGQPVPYPTFCLRLDGKDPHVIPALQAYADSVRSEDEELANELIQIILLLSKEENTITSNNLITALRATRKGKK